MLCTANVLQAKMKEDWFMSIDLNVSGVSHHRQFLYFTFKGQADLFRFFLFRLSLTPQTFMMRIARGHPPLQARDMQILHYFEDQLIYDTTAVLTYVTQQGLTVIFA